MIVKEDQSIFLKIYEKEWDSSIFGFKCGYFEIVHKDGFSIDYGAGNLRISEILVDAKKDGFKFLTSKIDASEIYMVNFCLKNYGVLVDTELTFHKCRNSDVVFGESDYQGEIFYEKFKTYWDNSLLKLARELKFSRFFMDRNIKEETAIKIWETSIYNNCNGRADYTIIAFDDERPIGLMNIFEKSDISDIFLVILLPTYQNRKLGQKMIRFYEKNLDVSVKQQIVKTQLINYRSHIFYAKLGYKNVDAKHIIHFWL